MPFAEHARILVVDDDPNLQRMVSDYLSQNNLSVTVASRRAEMMRLLGSESFSLMILDMLLGSDDGLNILRDLRARSDLPVIIITGHRPDEVDRVVGLELGADDYITKPFSLRELLARVRVVLRRTDAARAGAVSEPIDRTCRISRFGRWTLDRRIRVLSNESGPITLTKSEYALLLAFVDASQRPLSREYLLQATRMHEDVFDRSVDVQILRLRRKLETDASNPTVIRTERGIGYVFTLAVEST